jgi:hypothetical protein
MSGLPERLDSWTIETVRDLAARGVYEGDLFDLKVMVPRDEPGKHRIRKACAAFANSKGGYLVFGVSDVKASPPAGRVVGIDASIDFPAEFGNFPGKCEPAVLWESRRPAIAVDPTRVVHVVFIASSWKAPHAVKDGDGWVFPKRTSGGTEPMSYSEVQQMFLGYYEKRLKLQLLKAELNQLSEMSGRITLARSEDFDSASFLPTLELRVLETVLSDTYSITHSYPEFLSCIAQLRPLVQTLNAHIETCRTFVAVHPQFGQRFRMGHGQTIESLKPQVKNLASDALVELEKILR